MSSLLELVRAGRTAEAVGLLDGLTDAERRSCVTGLRELRKELRKEPWNSQARRAYPALHVAGAACQTGAAGVASWLAAADMRWSGASPALLLYVLGDRESDWLADVAHRLAERPATAWVPYELMAGLVRLAGCAAPTTDAYVRGWVDHVHGSWQLGGTLTDRLAQDRHLVPLVAALFETDDIGGRLAWPNDDGPDSWTGALAGLTARGALDRRATVDACVARLLRGGTSADLRLFLRLLKALALSREEARERIADWLALASDAPSPVAAHAQSVLASLALDGGLDTRRLAEMSGAVLFRSEKKLARAQLVLLGKVLARDATAAVELLPAAAEAFGHQDSDIQERALKLVERYLKKAGAPELRDRLAADAERLIPALRARAVGTLGAAPAAPAAPGDAGYAEVLPPVQVPVRLAPSPETAAEVAEETGAALLAHDDVTGFERALDGLVRHAYHDRNGLLEALEPVVARQWWRGEEAAVRSHAEAYLTTAHRGFFNVAQGLGLVLAALFGGVRTDTLHRAVTHGTSPRACLHCALSRAFDARLWEVAHRLATEPLPLLLSTPSWSNGLLEPEELVDRLEAYRRLGARVAPSDFAQALLRVRRADRAAAVAAAERAAALGTAEGDRLAHWLAAPEPAAPTHGRRVADGRLLVEYGEVPELLAFEADFPAVFRPLARPVSVRVDHRYCPHWETPIRAHWLALLPERRELVAVRLVRDFSALAVDDARGAASVLPTLAESGGAAGDAVHLGLAYALGARHPEDRLAAVDALLVLAARGQLDTAGLGADLGDLVRRGAVKPLRLAESARTAADTGAHATLWGVLQHTLPVLLADLAPGGGAAAARGLGELLAVAAECAERSGARGEIPHLAQAAARRGSSRLVAQARRLREALAEEAAA
ncbi:DUF6493 family protein [Streptomyces sp. NPDC006997]|uniref:DUF7824 domain-containing protein n=1 Tax=Streptomyces sp. NPDC006997 TaxID=3155356 RepID=UPI0033C2F7B2